MPSWANQPNQRYDHDMINYRPGIDDQMARVLHVNDVNEENDDKIAIHAVNSSDNANARALKVEGKTEFDGRVVIDDLGADANALEVTNTHGAATARAFRATGKAEVQNGQLLLNNASLEEAGAGNLLIGTALANQVHISRIGHGTRVFGHLDVCNGVNVGPGNGPGTIDALSDFDLQIGAGATTADVNIGRATQDVNVADDLNVGGKVVIDDLDENATALKTTNSNAEANALALEVVGKTKLNGAVSMGQAGGKVTVMGELRVNEELHVNDLLVAEAAACVVGNLTCESNVHLEADLRVDGDVVVGPGDAAALIDARNSQDLQIGTSASTVDVNLSRAGQTVDMMGQARLNSNALITNNAASIIDVAGCGIVHNPAGQGVIVPSIDFYIDGVCVFYVDANGGHDV